MNNLDKYNKVFTETFSIKLEKLNEQFTFRSVPMWDSVAHMELISSIEDTFDIMLDTDDILDFTSYNDGKIILEKYEIKL